MRFKSILNITLILGLALTGCAQSQTVLQESQDVQSAEAGQNQEEVTMNQEEQDINQEETVETSQEEEVMVETQGQFDIPAAYEKAHIDVRYGTLNPITYYSETTKTDRKAYVLLPAGYTTEKEYPILYLLHGIGGDENEWLYGKPEYVIGNLIAAQEAQEMIVVFPNVRARADDAANPSDIFTLEHFQAFDNFINDLSNDLMPYMAENYAIKTGRENTAIAGLSMGGRESLYIGFSMPETFGYIGAFCPAFGVLGYSNNNVTEEGLFTPESFVLPKDLETLVMIVKGKEDGVVRDEPVKYHNALVNNEVPHIYYETEGGHDFNVWDHGLYQFAKRIFQSSETWQEDLYEENTQ